MKRRTKIIGIAAAGLIAASARRRNQRLIPLDGIDGPMTLSRDALGIPRIVAGSRADALFGFGFAVAQDRLWQMDLLRRTALGRLSEIAGPATLESDRFMRLLGINHVVGTQVEEMSDDTRRQ